MYEVLRETRTKTHTIIPVIALLVNFWPIFSHSLFDSFFLIAFLSAFNLNIYILLLQRPTNKTMDVNRYATKKTIAQGMLDFKVQNKNKENSGSDFFDIIRIKFGGYTMGCRRRIATEQAGSNRPEFKLQVHTGQILKGSPQP